MKGAIIKATKNLGPSSASQSKFNYAYDAGGNIRTWTLQAGALVGEYYDLSYDRTDQLLTAFLRNSITRAMVKPYTYRYDAAGNRTSEQVDNGVTTVTINSLNQITGTAGGGALTLEGTVSEPSLVTVGGQSVAVDASNRFRATVAVNAGANSIPIVATDGSGNSTSKAAQISVATSSRFMNYDNNGNLILQGSVFPDFVYEWDAVNRLTAISYSVGNKRTEFSYDGMGRRVQIVEKTGATVTSTKRFVWIGNHPVEERDGSNTVTRRFFSEGEQIGGTAYLFTRDHLGSVREMVDLSGVVQARYAYDPYGRRTKVSGSLEADFGFTGHYYHAPSQLHLALYRAYDAGKGRWISRDPLGEKGGINLYGYVGNEPIRLVDQKGLESDVPSGVWWSPEQCPSGQETRFIQVVTWPDGHKDIDNGATPWTKEWLFGGAFRAEGNLYPERNQLAPGIFGDNPSAFTKATFEVCRACLCNGKVVSVGPCKTYKAGDNGDLSDRDFPGSDSPSPGFPTSK